MTPSSSYRRGDCCGSADCVYLDDTLGAGQCWGQVEVIDELECGTEEEPEWMWIHACPGHHEVWGGYGPYQPEPTPAAPEAAPVKPTLPS